MGLTVLAPATHDEYVAFCEAIRRICSIDLLQYKRGQICLLYTSPSPRDS